MCGGLLHVVLQVLFWDLWRFFMSADSNTWVVCTLLVRTMYGLAVRIDTYVRLLYFLFVGLRSMYCVLYVCVAGFCIDHRWWWGRRREALLCAWYVQTITITDWSGSLRRRAVYILLLCCLHLDWRYFCTTTAVNPVFVIVPCPGEMLTMWQCVSQVSCSPWSYRRRVFILFICSGRGAVWLIIYLFVLLLFFFSSSQFLRAYCKYTRTSCPTGKKTEKAQTFPKIVSREPLRI